MKLEKQVCSLELAKKLKELGIKQESIFYWQNADCNKPIKKFYNQVKGEDEYDNLTIRYSEILEPPKSLADTLCNKKPFESYSAFTVAELGEVLPVTLGAKTDKIKQIDVECYKYENNYGIQLSDYQLDESNCLMPHNLYSFNSSTEADVRAEALIYLLENNLMNIKWIT